MNCFVFHCCPVLMAEQLRFDLAQFYSLAPDLHLSKSAPRGPKMKHSGTIWGFITTTSSHILEETVVRICCHKIADPSLPIPIQFPSTFLPTSAWESIRPRKSMAPLEVHRTKSPVRYKRGASPWKKTTHQQSLDTIIQTVSI